MFFGEGAIFLSWKKIIFRILQILIVLVGISFLTFLLTYLAPGDPAKNMLTSSGVMPTPDVVEALRDQMGYNDPFFVQYFRWLGNALHGDFGISFSMNQPVVDLLLARLWPTLKLALLSLVLMLVIAVPLGMLSAVKQNSWIDNLVRGLSFLGVSVPNFWVGLLLMLLFCVQLRILPVISSGDSFVSMILPAVTLAIAMSAKYTRQVRTAILEELNQDYVTGARARGISEKKILWTNVLPNAFFPLVTMLGLSFGSLLGGTAVVEVIFSYPGLGSLAVSAIKANDYNLIQGYVLWVALIYMAVNLIVDISYNFFDPRMRLTR